MAIKYQPIFTSPKGELISTMHVCGTPLPLPRGVKIERAELRGTNLTLYFGIFEEPTLKIAQEVFGVPPLVKAQIFDWHINTWLEPVEIYQIDANELKELPPIKAEIKN